MKTLSILATSALLTFGAVAPSFAAPTQTAATQGMIDMNQAISIAQQNAQGKLKSIDFDRDDSEYEVEFASSTNKYEIKVDSRTGNVKSSKQKRIDADDKEKYQTLNTAKIDLTKAMQIAARNLNGQAIEGEFDIENGRAVYEIKVIQNNQKYKAEIDANTGAVVSTKRD